MLAGKTALVTGSTSGIGLGTIKAFVKHGATVIMHGLDQQSKMTDQLKILNNPKYIQKDISKKQNIKSLVDNLKGVDILVNNAGTQHINSLQNFQQDKWDQIINLNLNTLFHTTKGFLPYMKQKKWGRIINISSIHGLIASVNKSAYIASKHGVIGLTKATAIQNCRFGITCNAICPGWVLTPLIKKQIQNIAQQRKIPYEQAKQALILQKQPSGQSVRPQDIGQLISFLCSNSASQMNGSHYSIDGGWTIV